MKLKVTPKDVFLGSEPPLPSGFPDPLTPPSPEIFQHAFRYEGVDFSGITHCLFFVYLCAPKIRVSFCS